jgi:hypothetical protein
MTNPLKNKSACIRALLWVGVALFFVIFLGSSIVPEKVMPAIGLQAYDDFIIRLYGIFQLSWAILFLFALKDVEKSLAIINAAVILRAEMNAARPRRPKLTGPEPPRPLS